MRIEFGKVKKTRVINTGGSTESRTTKYVKGLESLPRNVEYEIREKVRSQKEEQEVYLEFSEYCKKHQDTILNPHFKIEGSKFIKSKGYYYAVKCYGFLED